MLDVKSQDRTVIRIARRTRGQSHGPITRLMSPSDFGRLLKPGLQISVFRHYRTHEAPLPSSRTSIKSKTRTPWGACLRIPRTGVASDGNVIASQMAGSRTTVTL